ncbi:MAG: helix-turn-helix transcriptional regulator [Lachnospiraceae bacterium]|jgi:putative transcriptional regulator|nr:helix-turn-helix transcriptional regulator [Lachnospiraceae bacterium]
MVSYAPLWRTMNEKQVTQYRLIKKYGVSAGQIGRLKKNMYVSTHTIEMLCSILSCPVEDVMEVFPDIPQEQPFSK